ncbi:hypothetical protein D3C74_341140 [compost metagenome]
MTPVRSSRGARRTGVGDSTTVVSVSRTSPMRSAETAARGTIMKIMVDIITAMRMYMM